MKYTYLLIALLFVPFVSAENSTKNSVLDAKQVVLDIRATEFMMQFEVLDSFSSNKTTNTISQKREAFKIKLAETKQAKTEETFEENYKELKDIAAELKSEVRKEFGSQREAIRTKLKETEEERVIATKEKRELAKEIRKEVLKQAMQAKITELETYIQKGTASDLHKKLLEQHKKRNIDDIDTTIHSGFSREDVDDVLTSAKKIFDELKYDIGKKIKNMGGTHEE